MLSKLPLFGFDPEFAERCIEANKHSNVSAAYFLLLKKFLANGEIIGKKPERDLSPNKIHASGTIDQRPPLFRLSSGNKHLHKTDMPRKRSSSRRPVSAVRNQMGHRKNGESQVSKIRQRRKGRRGSAGYKNTSL